MVYHHFLLLCITSFFFSISNAMQQSNVQQNSPLSQQPAQAQTITQAFFNENYTAPFHVQSKVNQDIQLNTVGFAPALVQKRIWQKPESPIETITCDTYGNIAIVGDHEQVSVGNRSSTTLKTLQFLMSACHDLPDTDPSKSTALWEPDGSIDVINYDNRIYHWSPDSLQRENSSPKYRCLINDSVSCVAQNEKTIFLGLYNGMICVKVSDHYFAIFSPKNSAPVRSITIIDDKHIAAVYGEEQIIFLDLSQLNTSEFNIALLKPSKNNVQTSIHRLDGILCTAIAALDQETIIVGSSDGLIRIFKKIQNEWKMQTEARGADTEITKIIPCGECIVVIGKNNPAAYVRYLTGDLIYTINAPAGHSIVTVSTFPDGSLAVAYTNNDIELFEVQTKALQALQNNHLAELQALNAFMLTLANFELTDIPRDTEHLGKDNLALLRRLPISVRNNLIQNYRCFIDTKNWETEDQIPTQTNPLPQQPPQQNAHVENVPELQPMPLPANNFLKKIQRFFSKNKVIMGVFAVATLVVLTGKPTKVANKLRPIVKFPVTLYSYFFCRPLCPPLSTTPFENHVFIP